MRVTGVCRIARLLPCGVPQEVISPAPKPVTVVP